MMPSIYDERALLPATATESDYFGLLVFPHDDDHALARRTKGTLRGQGTLTFAQGVARFDGFAGDIDLAGHLSALAYVTQSEAIDGTYAVSLYREHRTAVEANNDILGIALHQFAGEGALRALALAWVGALHIMQGGQPRGALRRVADVYRRWTVDTQESVQRALVEFRLDAGH